MLITGGCNLRLVTGGCDMRLVTDGCDMRLVTGESGGFALHKSARVEAQEGKHKSIQLLVKKLQGLLWAWTWQKRRRKFPAGRRYLLIRGHPQSGHRDPQPARRWTARRPGLLC